MNNMILVIIHLFGICLILSQINVSIKLKLENIKSLILFLIGILIICGTYIPTSKKYITSYDIYKLEQIYSTDRVGETHKNIVLETSNGGYVFNENSNYKYNGHGKQLRIYKNIHFWCIKGHYKYIID